MRKWMVSVIVVIAGGVAGAAGVAVMGCGQVSLPACPAGFDDCNDNQADGCEADLASAQSCGACGVVCEAPAGAAPICEPDGCDFACGDGLVRCGAVCADRCDAQFDTPGEAEFVVPAGCERVQIKAWGAGGGNGAGNGSAGAGGFAQVERATTPGDVLIVVVGAPGAAASGNTPGVGGAPGGGSGGSASSQGGGGGGGFSGVFVAPLADAGQDAALVIAGGAGGSGGGSGGSVVAGAGGGDAGQSGGGGNGGAGGDRAGGFDALAGGPGGSQNNGDGAGGGGAGFFGGLGGQGANSDAGGGGGGSGFAAGDSEAVTLEAGNRQTPGGVDDPDRGGAGTPGDPGKVVIDCLSL